MRKPLVTRGERFDLSTVSQQIEEVIDAFDHYLEASPYRLGRTKHAVMGPVAKVLERAGSGHWSAEALAGYALRVHEMNPKARGFVPAEARSAMERGVQELIRLTHMVPVTALGKVLERLEYGLYYRRRKRASEWMEGIRKEFEKFLRSRYKSVEALREAWKDQNATFEIYPSRKNEAYRKGKGKRKEDIDAFYANLKLEEDIEVEEE